MVIFYQESPVDYQNYGFPYRVWAEWENTEPLENVWSCGFLPFSGDPEEPRHLFYLARSVRYELSKFALRKQRRYDFRAVEASAPRWEVGRKESILSTLPENWRDLAKEWMRLRFGDAYLSPARLDYILRKPYCSHFATVWLGEELIAVALLGVGEAAAHYWYAFYDPQRLGSAPLGKWLIAKAAFWAREIGLAHLYVGTGYRAKAGYKAQGIEGAQFFDGRRWNSDMEEFKRRLASDPA
jgi:hypothetical protein